MWRSVMRRMAVAAVLLTAVSGRSSGQQLARADSIAIERAAAEFSLKTLPGGTIGLDGATFHGEHGERANPTGRDGARIAMLARALGATLVRADSVHICPGNPDTCQLAVAALVRMSAPVVALEGARIVVEVRRHTGSSRQPVGRGTKELILEKKDGSWIVIGVGRRSAT
jgi:hypothetical protein